MTTADRLLEQMFSWIHQRSLCADHLVKLARELETHRENCKGVEAVGSSVAVGGAACVIGAGIVTLLTGGAAIPFLGLIGGACLGAGAVVSMTTKFVEFFLSSSTMKDAKETEKKSDELAEDIKRLFEELKLEATKKEEAKKEEAKKKEAKKKEAKKKEAKKEEANRFTDPEDLDRHINKEILRAVARRSGVKINIDYRMMDELYGSVGGRQHYRRLSRRLDPKILALGVGPILVSVTGVLGFFSLMSTGKTSKCLFDKGRQQLIKKISVTGLKTVLKGGGKLVGGAIGLGFALHDAIDSWTDLIKNNHVTEASQSLRDTAESIRKICQVLEDQFEDMKKMLKEMEEEQRKQAKIKRIIENPNRSSEDEKTLIKFAMENCEIKEVKQWLSEYPGDETFNGLVDLFRLMKDEIIMKSIEDESRYENYEVDVIFVAHGAITGPMIQGSCLLPQIPPNIQDVVLYSPWNCLLEAGAAYGIATGLMQPDHREFICDPKSGCKIPDKEHKPKNLPPGWNSMKGEEWIPNIMVTTISDPKDGAWKGFEYLTETLGRPRKRRIVVPFKLGGRKVTIPFYIITWVMSLVLFFFGIKATVHLTACLGYGSNPNPMQEIPREFLEDQYCCTIDNTMMTSSPGMWPIEDNDLYRNLRAMFD